MSNIVDMFQMVGTGLLKKKVKVSIDTDEVFNKKLELKIKEGENIIKSMLNAKAMEYGFDSIDTACAYTGYPNRFQKLSMQFTAWRGAVWSFFEDYADNIKTVSKSIPDDIMIVINQAPTFESIVIS